MKFPDTLTARAIEAFTEGKERTTRLLQKLGESGEKLDAEIRSAAAAGLNAANREYDSLIQQLKADAGANGTRRAYKKNYDRKTKIETAAAMAGAEPVKKRSKMSAKARKAISLAQKKRWAKTKRAAASK
jgi:hypothetical protein